MATNKIWKQYINFSNNSESWVTKNLLYIVFLGLLTIVYIANAHYSERKVREIQNLQQEIRQLRYNYMAIESDLMYRSKQSEVAKIVEPLGIKELDDKPKKIIISDYGEY